MLLLLDISGRTILLLNDDQPEFNSWREIRRKHQAVSWRAPRDLSTKIWIKTSPKAKHTVDVERKPQKFNVYVNYLQIHILYDIYTYARCFNSTSLHSPWLLYTLYETFKPMTACVECLFVSVFQLWLLLSVSWHVSVCVECVCWPTLWSHHGYGSGAACGESIRCIAGANGPS